MTKIYIKNNMACIVCGHVFRKERPVLLIDWDGKNSPAFMCGLDDHGALSDGSFDAAVVGFGHLLQEDSTLSTLVEIDSGYEYERGSVGEDWIKIRIDPETH